MPTPTGEAGGHGAPPPWLPDEATLTRWANEFFATPPAVATTPPALGAPGPAGQPAISPERPTDPAFYFIDPARAADAATGALPSGALPTGAVPAGVAYDPASVRAQFPILRERVNGHRLVWLDNAATTQKPQAVIDRLSEFYARENSNIHRGAHTLAARATDAYEGARESAARFLGATSPDSIVFTRGATEAINLVAQAWGGAHVGVGDEILISYLEHHSNIVPWRQLAERVGATLRVIPVGDDGQVDLTAFHRLLGERTRLVAVTHVSNALGTIVPIEPIIAAAKAVGARTLIDGAQSVAHLPVDVTALGVDFYAFSGHKVFAPTGIGALYGTPEALAETPPWQGGGSMIKDVAFDRVVYHEPPTRFEAGTASIADAVGLGAALDFVDSLGRPAIAGYEHDLLDYALRALASVPGLRLVANPAARASVLPFTLAGRAPEEVAAALDRQGIAVRAGHHCAQPILRRFGLETSVRASLSLYNTHADVDALAQALRHLATGGRPRWHG